MLYYMLNTGDTSEIDRDGIDRRIIDRMKHICDSGIFDMRSFNDQYAKWKVEVDRLDSVMVATILCNDRPTTFYVVAGKSSEAESAWKSMESMYFRITDLPQWRSSDFPSPRMPATAPWCAAAIVNAITADWYGTFITSHAAAFLETLQ